MNKSLPAKINYMSTVFELFFRYKLELTLAETAARCKTTEEQVKPMLEKLSERGWLTFSKNKMTYSYGMKLLPFTREERLKEELVRQVTPVMKQLSQDSGQCVMLNYLEGMKSICVQKVMPKNSIYIAARVGKDYPLHAGSSSRVLLAYAPEAVRAGVLSSRLKKYTPFTITDPEKLSDSLFEIRRTGYCCSTEEMDPGAGSVSCAILDESSNLLGVLTIIGTRFAFEKENMLWKALLFEAVKKIK